MRTYKHRYITIEIEIEVETEIYKSKFIRGVDSHEGAEKYHDRLSANWRTK
jgi:hypothetical protein